MVARIKENIPIYKNKLKASTNWWAYAAVLGLLGTWLSGSSIEQNSGDTSYSFKMDLNITSSVITFLWLGFLYHAVRSNKLAKKKYSQAIELYKEFLFFDTDGITYGIEDTYEIKLSWSIVGYYSINKTTLELGLPSSGICVEIDEFEEFDNEEFIKLMEEKEITKY